MSAQIRMDQQMQSDLPRLEAIFSEAVAKSTPRERAAFLDQACADDLDLRRRVERLLISHATAGQFMSAPASPFLNEQPGAIIDRYKLLEQIGEGGFGVVFMAEQEHPIRRRVALKIIKLGMDTKQVIAQFEAERQALAMMDHPSIARVFDAGATDTGRPYFVMELVKGIPITKYCDQENLGTRERLSLFIAVCNAVQHAHQRGIIHRDLKPSNVLVTVQDGRPVPKVIDFGIAKATQSRLTEKTLFTEFRHLIGTPAYMSPEQAETIGTDADTRSDIYSLGVLFYELLTGTTPFDTKQLISAAYDEMRRIIREVEPQPPSTRLSSLAADALTAVARQRQSDPRRLLRLLHGDLDWIVMRCLEKDRNRRYETADSLARDVQRYLADEPVEACPPTAAYRFRKFAHRNRVALWTVVLVSASLVLGTAISTWQAVRATRAQHLALAARTAEALERAEVEKQREQAQKNFEQARRTVDQYFTLVSENKLLDVPGLQPLRADLLEAALRFYREFDQSRANDPALLADLAVSYLRVSVVYHASDRNDDAVAALQKGLAIVEQLRHDHPDAAEHHRKLAGFWKGWRRAQAETQLPRDPRAAFQVLQRLTELWEQFAQENPATLGFQSDLAATYYLIADLLLSSGRRDEGMAFLERSRAGLDQLVHKNPQVPEFRADLARTCEDIAWRLIDPADSQKADVLSRQALALRDQLVKDFPDVPQYQLDLAETLKSFGDRAVRNHNLQEARTTYIRAVELSRNLADKFPLVPLYSETLVVTQHQLLKVLESTGQVSDQQAEHDRRQEIEAVAKLTSQFPTNSIFPFHLALCHRELAMILAAHDRPDEAIVAHTRASQLLEKLANDHPDRPYYRSVLARTQLDFGELLVDRGRPTDGEKFCRQALDSYAKLVQEYPASAVYARDLEECRRRLATALQERKPTIDANGVSDKTK